MEKEKKAFFHKCTKLAQKYHALVFREPGSDTIKFDLHYTSVKCVDDDDGYHNPCFLWITDGFSERYFETDEKGALYLLELVLASASKKEVAF